MHAEFVSGIIQVILRTHACQKVRRERSALQKKKKMSPFQFRLTLVGCDEEAAHV